jgi:hypothetical protein
MWLPYLAMATALLPLILMGVGYILLGKKKSAGE